MDYFSPYFGYFWGGFGLAFLPGELFGGDCPDCTDGLDFWDVLRAFECGVWGVFLRCGVVFGVVVFVGI